MTARRLQSWHVAGVRADRGGAMMTFLPILLLAGLAGCSDYATKGENYELADSADADTAASTDSYESVSPEWYAVRASLTIGASFALVAAGTCSGRVMMAVARAVAQVQLRGAVSSVRTAPAITFWAMRAFWVRLAMISSTVTES